MTTISPIISKLRAVQYDKDNFPRMPQEKWLPVSLALDAADEIERLEREIRAIHQDHGAVYSQMQNDLREAREKESRMFKQYRRKQIAELRPWQEGDNMDSVSIGVVDRDNGSPKEGDMIARNPKDHADQWLVAKKYFEDNFEELSQSSGSKLPAFRCDACDNGVEIEWKFCAWCGADWRPHLKGDRRSGCEA